MPKGATKRRPATINALLDAALEQFAEQGFGATLHPGHLRPGGADQRCVLLELRQQGRPLLGLVGPQLGQAGGMAPLRYARRRKAGGGREGSSGLRPTLIGSGRSFR